MRKPGTAFLQKKYLKERIQSEAQPRGPHPFTIVLDGLKPGFNVAKIFRSANAFGCGEVLLVGIGHFDVRAAMGAFRQTRSKRFNDFAECHAYLEATGQKIYALAPGAGASLGLAPIPASAAFVFGHEEFGLSFALADFPTVTPISIPQYGSVESLNVSNAASIVMYEWVRRHADPAAAVTPPARPIDERSRS